MKTIGPYPRPKPVYIKITETRGRKLIDSLMEGSRDGAIQLKADSEAVARHTNDPENKYKGLLRACTTFSQILYIFLCLGLDIQNLQSLLFLTPHQTDAMMQWGIGTLLMATYSHNLYAQLKQ